MGKVWGKIIYSIQQKSLHVFALSLLAITAPLLNIFSTFSEFITAHKIEEHLIVFSTLLVLVMPLSFVISQVLIYLLSTKLAQIYHNILMFLLSLIFIIQLLNKIPIHENWFYNSIILLGAIILSCIICVLYQRMKIIGSVLSLLSLSALILPVTFLYNKSIFPLLKKSFSQDDKPLNSNRNISSRIPITFIIFDELDILSLMNSKMMINQSRFPNFYKILNNFDWFPNAVSVHPSTVVAISSILTGHAFKNKQEIDESKISENLFTILGSNYNFNVYDDTTYTCPKSLCEKARFTYPNDLKVLIDDSFVVFLQLITPKIFRNHLPSVGGNWKNFKPKKAETIPNKFKEFQNNINTKSTRRARNGRMVISF